MHSFSHATCVAGRKALPQMPIYFLITSQEKALSRTWSSFIDDAIALAVKAGLDGIAANLSHLIDADTVASIHAAGLNLNIWTVDEPKEAERLIGLGVDGIITNRPGWLRTHV